MDILISLLITISTAFSLSCEKDSDLLGQVLINDQLVDIENRDSRRIPSDFDWSKIPSDFSNTIWEIEDEFDLRGQTITLPPNVTLLFKGGVLRNGSIIGDEADIVLNKPYQVFDAMDLAGTFKNKYIKPSWFGAAMDGITDDRAAFVETLTESNNINAKILIEKDIFLDVEETGTKSIFLEDNIWIEGAYDASIIINNLLSPAFFMALTKDITIKNLIFLYDQTYDATFGWSVKSNSLNTNQLRNYLSSTKKIVFNSANPAWKGPIAFRAIFSLEAAENISFDNVMFKAKGETADTFIQWAIKLKEQYTANQTVTNSTGTKDIPRGVNFNNVTMDGVLMGVQGIVDGFRSNGLRSYRYSDVQDINGNYIGGNPGDDTYWMPPPHLIYLNDDNSNDYNSQNIELLNTIDYGIYVGGKNVRPSISGYCNSVKLVENVENVVVDNYKSYRRDGFGDIGKIVNGTFKNIYVESKIGIFDPSFNYQSLRFLGNLNNVVFDSIILKDNSGKLEIHPLDVTDGDYVTMNGVHVFVNELSTSSNGLFGISGSNNRIINSSLTIKKHTSIQEYKGVIFHRPSARVAGSDNHYEITVNGWRDVDSNLESKSIRMLFLESSNPNTNYAKVTDVSNNLIREQTNEMNRDTWTRSEEITLGQGSNHKLDITIPKGFTVQKISAVTIEELVKSINVSIGTSTSGAENLLSPVSNTKGIVSKTIHEENAIESDRSVYLLANSDFQNKGKIEVTLELVRLTEPN
ncbi:hypothetical protein [Ulvibacterium marinum]|uniref:hypothetical protein n=1 Tax=Ulvibacterium marinum TaxID=2419782 RepID=UPI002493D786|nr:hypothetical protein [Ulvibacterium marinum]